MHIRVELDFVPVEEQLPETEKPVFIMPAPMMSMFPFHVGFLDCSGGFLDPWASSGKWHLLSPSGIWRSAIEQGVHVTHWAEIPEVNDAG